MEDLTGRQFGQYQIVASLGEGGMAAVYKAYQPAMERFVAVKVLPRHMASAEFVIRFRREARMLAQLQHPHILPVFDYGEADDYPYIVMPFVHSGTMADILHTRRLSFLEVRRIMTQIGDALSYAHARGMIHRDIKPSNILIDERGNCLLTDFGLARMVQGSTQLTTSGTIMGTPAYMSPEQGAGSNVDHRSDIYSLGIILYEVVTGRVPFTAETPVAVVFKHIQDPLPSARKFNPDLPEGVELVLLKALAKSPDDRYQTVDDFVHAIQKVIPDTLLDDKVSTQAHSSSLETAISPIVAQAAEREGIAIERGTKDVVAQPHSRLLKKSSQTFAIVKNRKLFTALIFILVGLVLVSMISLAQSYKILVIDPALITETYNISNLSTSTSMDNYYTTSTLIVQGFFCKLDQVFPRKVVW
jgi:serine/threonine protein kinase